MSFLANIVSILTTDIRLIFIALIIVYSVYRVIKFYTFVSGLPPGPIALPFIGNAPQFLIGIIKTGHITEQLEKYVQKYNPIFTIFFGEFPIVFITDIDMAKDSFNKPEFSGRHDTLIGRIFNQDKYIGISLSDSCKEWETLRSLFHLSLEKYLSTNKLQNVVIDCVDQTIDTIVRTEGWDKPFVPFDYTYYMIFNIISDFCVGARYNFEDKDWKEIIENYLINSFMNDNKKQLAIYELAPFCRPFCGAFADKSKNFCANNKNYFKNQLKNHLKDYSETNIRDFCDELISAKNKAILECKDSASYFTDNNLTMVIIDTFWAGIENTRMSVNWLLLLLLYYPDIQQKLRQEIESEIGDRILAIEDKNGCHYVMAFISESLRFRNITPFSVFHKAEVNSTIGSYQIPKGTMVYICQDHILTTDKYWKNGDQFIPERFLSNGKYVTTRPKAYIPFSVGRRGCIGEKLALNVLFIFLVRFIQKTSEYDITLHKHNGLKPNPNYLEGMEASPKEYEIKLSKK